MLRISAADLGTPQNRLAASTTKPAMSAERNPVSAAGDGNALPDFRAIFEAAPGVELVLAPDAPHFTMLAASDARFAATLTRREETIGRPLLDVFSDANPENSEPSGVAKLRASLETVLRTREKHRMAVQRYDLRRPDGEQDVLVRHRVTGTDRVLRGVASPVAVAQAVVAAVMVTTDITDQVRARREAETLLADSELARADAEAARARSDAVLGSIAGAF